MHMHPGTHRCTAQAQRHKTSPKGPVDRWSWAGSLCMTQNSITNGTGQGCMGERGKLKGLLDVVIYSCCLYALDGAEIPRHLSLHLGCR